MRPSRVVGRLNAPPSARSRPWASGRPAVRSCLHRVVVVLNRLPDEGHVAQQRHLGDRRVRSFCSKMPPITTVPPFSTSTCVFTCLVLIAKPAAVAAPTLSLLTSTSRMMLPSGVICGVTSSFRLALRNCDRRGAAGGGHLVRQLRALLDQRLHLVGGDDARARHDLALAVGFQRRDLEVQEAVGRRAEQRQRRTSPGRSRPAPMRRQVDEAACSAKSSRRRSAPVCAADAVVVAADGDPVVAADPSPECHRAGRAGRRRPSLHAERPAEACRSPRRCAPRSAPGAPGCRSWRSAPAISSSLDGMSVTKSWLVRGSEITLPRGDRMREVCRRRRHRRRCRRAGQALGDVLGLGVVELERLRAQRLELGDLLAAPRARAFSLAASSSFGAIQSTLPVLRMPRPLACRMMSSAWSQGTSFRRSVTAAGDGVAGDDVEVGEVGDDLQQRAHFDVLEVQRQLLALVARALRQLVRVDLHAAALRARTGCRSGRRCAPRRRAARSTMRTRSPLWNVETVCTGVPKSVTSRRRRRLSGSVERRNSTTRLWPCWRMSTPTWLLGQVDDDAAGAIGAAAEVDVAQRQLVAVLRSARSAGRRPRRCRPRRRRGAGVERRSAAPCPRAARGSWRPACRLSTRRVRSPACATLTERRLPWLISTRGAAQRIAHARQVDARRAAAPGS